MTTSTVSKFFPLGQTVITSHALSTLHPAEGSAAWQRHATGDWGEVGPGGLGGK